MPKNITLYVRDEDAHTWEEARRFLAFYQRKSLSTFLKKKLGEYVNEERGKQQPTKVLRKLE